MAEVIIKPPNQPSARLPTNQPVAYSGQGYRMGVREPVHTLYHTLDTHWMEFRSMAQHISHIHSIRRFTHYRQFTVAGSTDCISLDWGRNLEDTHRAKGEDANCKLLTHTAEPGFKACKTGRVTPVLLLHH